MAIPLESLFANLGTSLGGGVAGGLENLAQLKLQNMAQARQQQQQDFQRNKLGDALEQRGMPRQWAYFDPKTQNALITNFYAGGGGENKETGLPSLSQPQKEQALEMDQFTANQQSQLPKSIKQGPVSGLDFLNMLNQSRLGALKPAGLTPAAIQSTAQPTQTEQRPIAQRVNEPERKITAEEAVSRGLTSKQRQAQKKEEFEREKLKQNQQKIINKETQPIYDEVIKEQKAAKISDQLTGRMKELLDKNELPNPLFYNLFKKMEESTGSAGAKIGAGLGAAAGGLFGASSVTLGTGGVGLPAALGAGGLGATIGGGLGGAAGAGIGAILSPVGTLFSYIQKKTSPSTEEFEKLSADFIRNVKSYFGARVTDQDLEYFFRTIPTLSQTNDGKEKIIRNMQLFNKAAHVRYKTMEDLIKENGGKRPENLAILINERSEKELDDLAQKFIKGLR